MFEVAPMRTSCVRRSLALVSIAAYALVVCVAATALRGSSVRQDDALESGRQAYEAGDYAKAAQSLQEAASKNPQNGEIQLLLTKTYYETQQHDAAIASGEKAVAIDSKNSSYHEW